MSQPIVLIVTDQPSLGIAIERLLRFAPPVEGGFDCFRCTYDQQGVFLNQQLIQLVSLLVLELVRTYSAGRRAEGIRSAREYSHRYGKACLVVSGFALGQEIRSDYYWDVGSRDLLEQRIRVLLRTGQRMPEHDMTELETRFQDLLRLPRQH
jgi:hypothetical protein